MQKSLGGVVLAVAFVTAFVGWFMIPALQRAERRVNGEVSPVLESSRQSLYEYQHGLAQKSLLLDDLAYAEVDIDFEDAGELSEGMEDEYQRVHGLAWETYKPRDYELPSRPREARASYGNLERQITEGVRARDEVLDHNAGLLDDALSEINRGMAFESGAVSGRSHAEANRLKGVVLYHKGLAARFQARSLRTDGAGLRMKLGLLAIRASALASSLESPPDDFTSQMAAIRDRISSLQGELDDHGNGLAALQASIEEVESLLESAKSRAASSLASMQQLQERGVDFSDPSGGDKFASQMSALSEAYRDAMRDAVALEFGTLPFAEIDRTGDYVKGRYIEKGEEGLTFKRGLVHLIDSRKITKAKVDALAATVTGLQKDAASLEAAMNARDRDREFAERRLLDIRDAAGSLAEDYLARHAEASDLEETALNMFRQADQAFRQAADSTRQWVSDSNQRTQQLSPETRDLSAFQKRAGSGWLAANISAQRADAMVASAWTLFERNHDLQGWAELLESYSEPLAIEGDADEARETAADARANIMTLGESSVRELKQAYGKAGRHWTFVAQLAGINDLMALIGNEAYRTDAIEAYRNALASREDESFAQEFVKRLSELEAIQ